MLVKIFSGSLFSISIALANSLQLGTTFEYATDFEKFIKSGKPNTNNFKINKLFVLRKKTDLNTLTSKYLMI